MDLSNDYIDMCRKAKEIQDQFDPLEVNNFIDSTFIEDAPTHNIYERIWLPRQDQLQNMAGDDWFNYYFVLQRECKGFSSAEQAGLSIVMRRKYGKAWNGSEWIKSHTFGALCTFKHTEKEVIEKDNWCEKEFTMDLIRDSIQNGRTTAIMMAADLGFHRCTTARNLKKYADGGLLTRSKIGYEFHYAIPEVQ